MPRSTYWIDGDDQSGDYEACVECDHALDDCSCIRCNSCGELANYCECTIPESEIATIPQKVIIMETDYINLLKYSDIMEKFGLI